VARVAAWFDALARESLSQFGGAVLRDPFAFVVAGEVVVREVAEAAALLPAVRELLSAHGCARRFLIGGFASSDSLSSQKPPDESLSFLFGRFKKDLSGLSVDGLDCLLSSEALCVECEDARLSALLCLGPSFQPLLRHIRPAFLSPDGLRALFAGLATPAEWALLAVSEQLRQSLLVRLDSLIVSDFPAILAEFRGEQFSLLWRGSRDGFGARDFHVRCDGHANTLTVILDTAGNVFGGFTPVAWESSSGFKADDSLKSFVFTLKNPHNIPARRFALKVAGKNLAIDCHSGCGPLFWEIGVSGECDSNTLSYTNVGGAYANDTGLDGKQVLTGSRQFRAKEVEVFEITE
jgi:hypothetical protein